MLYLVAYLGGLLTIASPCILPVLPFVFARADQPFARSGFPMLIGMAVVFAAVATLAALGGGWAVQANQAGRMAAMVLLALFGLALLFPAVGDRAMQPLVRLGGRTAAAAGGGPGTAPASFAGSLLLGAATGLLWAPCAGPILGLILTGAALNGTSAGTTILLLAYAAGAATSLALALLAGGRVFALMKRSLGAGEWIRRGLGAAVLVAVVAIFFGWDAGFLTRVSTASTTSLEQGLLDRLQPATTSAAPPGGGVMMTATKGEGAALPVEGTLPSLAGATTWLNSQPLSAETLKGKVVLIDFWTYSCINCLRSLPYVRAWAEKYRDQGLVVIGVHAPEFAFEKDLGNVQKAVADLGITYPVAVDNDYAIWRGFNNQYWPAHYFIDAKGQIRHHHFGEGRYDESEQVIRQLLAEAGQRNLAPGSVSISASGIEAGSDLSKVKSPETYIGYGRAANFTPADGLVHDEAHSYASTATALNQWGLGGDWTVGSEMATLNAAGGSITYRFHARDLHLVLGVPAGRQQVRFRVTVDGAPPGEKHGVDVDAAGNGVVAGDRLYQLVRQTGPIVDHTFEIEFLDPGVHAYSFTFG